MLDPLVRREQAERQHHGLAFNAEQILVARCGQHAWNAVGDQVDLLLAHAVDVTKEDGAVGAHHHETLREPGDLVDRTTLHGGGLAEDRVKGSHDRHPQLAEQREHVAAGLAAEDAVLVLHAHDIDRIHVQIIRGAAVRGDVVLGHLEANSRRIGMSMTAVVHCQHEAIEDWELDGDRIRQMSGERGDAALPR